MMNVKVNNQQQGNLAVGWGEGGWYWGAEHETPINLQQVFLF